MTSNWRKTRWAALTLLLVPAVSIGAGDARAGAPTATEDGAAAGWLAPESALRLTLRTGRPSVLVITSRTSPASGELVRALRRSADSTLVGRLVTFAEMPREDYGRHVERLGLKAFPAVLVYGKDRSGLKLIGHRVGPLDAPRALSWLASLSTAADSARASAPPVDPGVRRASQDGYPTPPSPQMPTPSPQNYAQPPPLAPPKMGYQPPPPQPQPVPVPVPVVPVQPAQVPPVYTAPQPQPVVVSTPAQPVVIQPAQPQIIVGPSQAPQITFATANAPTVSYVQPAGAPTANAPQQIFMANAPTAGAPTAGAPTAGAPVAYAPVAMAPQPMAMAPQPMAMAPQPTANAPTAAQSPIMAAALLTNPRLWERLLGALGEHLAQKKNPRIQMGNAPTIANAPVAMAPSALSPTGYAPVAQPALMAMPAMAPTAMAPAAMGMMVAQPVPGYAPQPGYGPPGYGPPNYGPPPGYGYGPPGGYGQPPYPPYPPPNAPTPQAGGAGVTPQGYPPAPQAQPGPSQENQGGLLHRLLHH